MPLIGSNRPVVSRCESCIRSLWFPLTRSEGKVPPTLAGVTSSQHFSMISPKYIKVQSRSTSNTQSPSFPSFIIILCQGFLKFDIASQYFLGVRLSLQYFSIFPQRSSSLASAQLAALPLLTSFILRNFYQVTQHAKIRPPKRYS
jgi:hypothetical protein